MKSKILFILLIFSCYIGCAQYSSSQKYTTDTSLSKYISSHFYNGNGADTCYSGIHFIKIQFSKQKPLIISISGELPDQYIERIKQLVKEFSASYFSPKFINYCKRKRKIIIQPILFDISSNCILNDSSLDKKNTSKILNDTTGRELPKLVSHNLIVQKLSIINSFKTIGNQRYSNCIILQSCIIQSKKIKNPPKA